MSKEEKNRKGSFEHHTIKMLWRVDYFTIKLGGKAWRPQSMWCSSWCDVAGSSQHRRVVGSPAGAPSSPSSGDTTQTQVDACSLPLTQCSQHRPQRWGSLGGMEGASRAPSGTGPAHQAEPDAPLQEWMEGNWDAPTTGQIATYWKKGHQTTALGPHPTCHLFLYCPWAMNDFYIFK